MKEQVTVKHWVKDALNKIILIVLIISFCQKGHTQKLLGKYCLESEERPIVTTCINFLENNEFTYSSFNHSSGSRYGKGHYTLENKKLVLNFDLTKYKTKDYETIERNDNNHSLDSIKVTIKAFDTRAKEEVPFVGVKIEPNDNRKLSLDKNGAISFKIKKSSNKKKLVLFHIGFQEHATYIVPNSDYDIEVFLEEHSGYRVTNQIWKYEIKKIDDSSFTVGFPFENKQVWRKQKK